MILNGSWALPGMIMEASEKTTVWRRCAGPARRGVEKGKERRVERVCKKGWSVRRAGWDDGEERRVEWRGEGEGRGEVGEEAGTRVQVVLSLCLWKVSSSNRNSKQRRQKQQRQA